MDGFSYCCSARDRLSKLTGWSAAVRRETVLLRQFDGNRHCLQKTAIGKQTSEGRQEGLSGHHDTGGKMSELSIGFDTTGTLWRWCVLPLMCRRCQIALQLLLVYIEPGLETEFFGQMPPGICILTGRFEPNTCNNFLWQMIAHTGLGFTLCIYPRTCQD